MLQSWKRDRLTQLKHVDCRQGDHSPNDQANRIDRLEFISSEREREKRLLQVVISHPSIDPDCNQLKDHIVGFLGNTMGMTGREIDTSMSVIRKGRPHSVMITFSSRLFKAFLFAARKRLRGENSDQISTLFINESLTQYNFSLLKLLKSEKKRRIDANLPSFQSVFSFDGKVYVKAAPDSEKFHIRNREVYAEFIKTFTRDITGIPSDSK